MVNIRSATHNSPQGIQRDSCKAREATRPQERGRGPQDGAGLIPSEASSDSIRTQDPQPQRINEPIQILQRPSPRQKEPTCALIPGTVLQTDSELQGRNKGQVREKDKAESSKARQRIAGSQDKEGIAPKPKTGPGNQRPLSSPR